MMSSRFTSDEMGHNPQAPGPAKKQAHFAEGKTPEEDTTFIDRWSYRSLRKTWELLRNDRYLFGLQNPWIYPNLVRWQEKFCNACEDDRVLECEIR